MLASLRQPKKPILVFMRKFWVARLASGLWNMLGLLFAAQAMKYSEKTKIKNITVTTGEYKAQDGEIKKRYQTIDTHLKFDSSLTKGAI